MSGVIIYKREDDFKGRHEVNHYHIPTEIRCYKVDYSDMRADGILVNGEPPKDTYNVETLNYKGVVLKNYKFYTPDEANECFKAITSKIKGFKRV